MNPRILQAAAQLQASLRSGGKHRCMGCNDTKDVDARWGVVGFEPANPAHPPVAYLLCGVCLNSKKRRERAALTIETMSRDMAERRST